MKEEFSFEGGLPPASHIIALNDMSVQIKTELKLAKFSREMSKELRNNEDKGNWEDFTEVDEIISELNYHIDKLYAKVYDVKRGSKPKEELKEHIADCANILMFLGNSYGLYDE